MFRKYRFYEGDTGEKPSVTEAPATVVHTVQAVPQDTTRIVEDTLPHAAINETLAGMTAAANALTEAANKMIDAGKTVVVEPTEIAPDITPPPPETRYVRRNGRKVKR